jgi:hypothetical protein
MKSKTKSPTPIFGTLMNMSVELPPENQEAADKMSELNQQISHLGFRTYRAAYDYGYLPLGNLDERTRDNFQKFHSGDLVKIFKTITDGDVFWQDTIALDREDYHHGYQKGMDSDDWVSMFYLQLPAKLVRKDGTVIFGSTDAFAETGSEGPIWSVNEYGKNSYDALNCLQDGDKLTVYSMVRDGEIDWQGRLSFTPEDVKDLELNDKGYKVEIMREALHMPTKEWHQLSWQERPVRIEKANTTLKIVK